MDEQKKRCAVCGEKVQRGDLCDRCKESFELFDIEEYAREKGERKIYGEEGQTLSKKSALW